MDFLRTKEHLGSSDIVIIEVRKALLKAIEQIEGGGEAPGLIRDSSEDYLADFICTSTYIEDDEDGPSYCRRILSARSAAE